ncbi:hypothetical protein SAMD00019534_077690, partial [Acytostelium subglobosum LB1]|uniref:hypothetical protein n=1 Tax=Acytostelium subglobosum LB1 TaxID=1410327 RepID=UPI000644E923
SFNPTNRNFITKNYAELKKVNPKLPVVVREGHGIEPAIYARYDGGHEEKRVVADMTELEVEAELKELCLIGGKFKRTTGAEADYDDITGYNNRSKLI